MNDLIHTSVINGVFLTRKRFCNSITDHIYKISNYMNIYRYLACTGIVTRVSLVHPIVGN